MRLTLDKKWNISCEREVKMKLTSRIKVLHPQFASTYIYYHTFAKKSIVIMHFIAYVKKRKNPARESGGVWIVTNGRLGQSEALLCASCPTNSIADLIMKTGVEMSVHTEVGQDIDDAFTVLVGIVAGANAIADNMDSYLDSARRSW